MAKIQVLDQTGKKAGEIETNIFNGKIREDIVQKIVEVEKESQPYAPFFQSGQQTSASGNVRHLRHMWKSDRGRGMARIPKKRMSRRGQRFVWVGAVIPGTRGGRRAHPPKLVSKFKKVNKKEQITGLKSALAIVASAELIKENYSSLKNKELNLTFPIIVDSKVLSLKTKDFFEAIKKIMGEASTVSIQKKSMRAGKGKFRGRKYKKNGGALFVIGDKETKKIKGIEVRNAKDISIGDLASNGARLVIFTEAAIKGMEARLK